jgi:hypothetical protein
VDETCGLYKIECCCSDVQAAVSTDDSVATMGAVFVADAESADENDVADEVDDISAGSLDKGMTDATIALDATDEA